MADDQAPAFHEDLAKDGGASSRKLWIVLIAMALCIGCGCIAAAWAAFGAHLGPVIDAVLYLVVIYCGANVGAKVTAAVASMKSKPEADK